jgi:4-aminobutyrate aminotransferase-like enzyme
VFPIPKLEDCKGNFVRDVDKNIYLDLSGRTIIGYNNDNTLSLSKLLTNSLWYAQSIEISTLPSITTADDFHSTIINISPSPLNDVALTSSLNEALDMAITMAKSNNLKSKVVVFKGCSGKIRLAAGESAREVEYPKDPKVDISVSIMDNNEQQCLKAISNIFSTESISSIIIEPIRESDFTMCSNLFYHALHDLCRKHGVTIIIDESNSGMNITGKIWAHQFWYQE